MNKKKPCFIFVQKKNQIKFFNWRQLFIPTEDLKKKKKI